MKAVNFLNWIWEDVLWQKMILLAFFIMIDTALQLLLKKKKKGCVSELPLEL